LDLKDSASAQRGRNDLLLQKITRDAAAYRVLDGPQPTEHDFVSHYHRGDRPREGAHYKAFSWLAVSMFADLEAPSLARIVQFIHREHDRPAYVARVILRTGEGLWTVYDPRRGGHHDVFGLPPALLRAVDDIVKI
jgi:hypothetical protein